MPSRSCLPVIPLVTFMADINDLKDFVAVQITTRKLNDKSYLLWEKSV